MRTLTELKVGFILCLIVFSLSFLAKGCFKIEPENTGIANVSKKADGEGTIIEGSKTEQFSESGRDSSQTSNIGFMSGGAPWLFLAILAILHAQKTVNLNKEKAYHREADIEIQKLKDKTEMLQINNNHLKIQAYQTAVRKDYLGEQENKQA